MCWTYIHPAFFSFVSLRSFRKVDGHRRILNYLRRNRRRGMVKAGIGSLNVCPLRQPRAFGRAVALLLSALNRALAGQ